MRALTIAELEQESGVPRQTVYYYVRTGLLPPAQKASPSRALYTDDHVALLREIEELRQQGLRRSAIKSRLEGRVRAAGSNGVDLVARREEETRQAILAAATRSFATKGYKGTRMADLIAELRITPQVLYAHFSTKRDLFVACYKVAVQYMDVFLQPRFESARDPAEMQVWYMYADTGIKAFAPNLMMMAVEAAQHDEEAKRDLREAYETIVGATIADFARMRRAKRRAALLRRAHHARARRGVRAYVRARFARRRVLLSGRPQELTRALPAGDGGVSRGRGHQRGHDQVWGVAR